MRRVLIHSTDQWRIRLSAELRRRQWLVVETERVSDAISALESKREFFDLVILSGSLADREWMVRQLLKRGEYDTHPAIIWVFHEGEVSRLDFEVVLRGRWGRIQTVSYGNMSEFRHRLEFVERHWPRQDKDKPKLVFVHGTNTRHASTDVMPYPRWESQMGCLPDELVIDVRVHGDLSLRHVSRSLPPDMRLRPRDLIGADHIARYSARNHRHTLERLAMRMADPDTNLFVVETMKGRDDLDVSMMTNMIFRLREAFSAAGLPRVVLRQEDDEYFFDARLYVFHTQMN